jgi:hypothetical protein
MPVALATTTEAIRRCFPIMAELRPQLAEAEFVERVQRQQRDGYQLAFLSDKKTLKAIADYRYSESLSWGKFMYVDDLVTAGGCSGGSSKRRNRARAISFISIRECNVLARIVFIWRAGWTSSVITSH